MQPDRPEPQRNPEREGTGEPPAWLASGRIPGLDGLRAIAVLLVVFAHLCQTSGFPNAPEVRKWGRAGAVGVDVFFVLSGFLITTLLCRERQRNGRISLRGFYRRRVLRIVPAYAALLLFVAALQFAGKASIPERDWLAALTYTMNFRWQPAWELGHLWSLSIEEHFYLVWPVLFLWFSPRWTVRGLTAILFVGPVLRWTLLIVWPHWSMMADLWTPTRLDAITVGCLVALLPRSRAGSGRLDAVARKWWLALAALLVNLTLAGLSGKYAVGVAPTVTALAIGVLVWACARWTPSWLELRPLVVVGIGSYSLYLWQQPFLNPREASWWTAFPQNLLFACLAAVLSYRLIERPFLRLKESPDSRQARTEEQHKPADLTGKA